MEPEPQPHWLTIKHAMEKFGVEMKYLEELVTEELVKYYIAEDGTLWLRIYDLIEYVPH
jgi:hypothetical protein